MKVMLTAILLLALGSSALAADSPALLQAKADAKRIGERQCEHALIMQRINQSQPETPERRASEKELADVIARAYREEEMDDRYRASRDTATAACRIRRGTNELESLGVFAE
jgi:septal ring factor EnvC (AmiA/AmiB activator)